MSLDTRPAPAARDAQRAGRTTYLTHGALAGLAAAIAVTLVAALARSAGVSFAIPSTDETVPASAFGTSVLFATAAGLVLAAALRRWSAAPAPRFVQVTTALTALSLVSPVALAGDAATAVTLAALHLLAAAVVVPTVAHRLAQGGPRG